MFARAKSAQAAKIAAKLDAHPGSARYPHQPATSPFPSRITPKPPPTDSASIGPLFDFQRSTRDLMTNFDRPLYEPCMCIKYATAIIHTISPDRCHKDLVLLLSLLIHLVPGIHVARPGTHVHSNFLFEV